MLHHIEHLDDPRVALYTRIGDGPYLRSRGLFVAEGRIVVRRLAATGETQAAGETPTTGETLTTGETQKKHRGFGVQSIFATPTAYRSLADDLPDALDVFVAEPAILNAITGFNFHRGCLAIGVRPPPATIDSFRGARRLLALEGIGNPDNVGGIFRVAAAFGVEGVVIDHATADPLYRKAIRTGMGAVFAVPFAPAASLVEALRELQDHGVRVVALTPGRDALTLEHYQARRPDRMVLALGCEGNGLSEEVLALADSRVRIPIREEVDSLNVAVAAGIALAALQ